MRGVRGWGRWLAAPVVVAAGLGAGTAPGAAQAAEPAVTLTPATGLVDGDTVTISATGLAPASSFAVLQCAADPAGGDYYDSCDTDDARFLSADPGGALTTTLRVDVHLALSGGGPAVDCRPAGACVIRLAGAPGDLSAPLAFDPDAPAAPAPTLTVDPATDLVDGQTVAVQAAGLVWTQSAVVIECAAGSTSSAGCDFDTIEYVDVGADGTAAASVRVNALLGTADGTVDCRLPGACVLAVTPDYGRTPERIGTAPLAFDPDGQVQLATLGATPDTDLVDGQTVTAAGTGYTDGFLSLFQCGDDGAGERCEYLDFAAAAPDGTFSAPVKVRAVLDLDGTGDLFDCRTSAQPCVLVATTTSPGSARAGRAPLHFRPDGPLEPGPAVTVSPGGPLGDEASITVTGTRFSPDGYASVQVCRIDDGSACDPQAYSQVTPDHAGTFTVDLGVAATFTDWRGQSVDCRAAPGCQVTGIDGPRNRRGSAQLSFAPASTEIERYLDPVFADVDITADVPYRTATTAAGQSVGLTLDVYQPTGDTETARPAIVWLPGGWFRPLGTQEMSPQIATAFARRGYVVIVPDYRQRPALQCCPTGDVTGVTNALLDAHADGRAAVAWVRSHAADYGIDDRAIVAGGSDAGAATALDLAHLPGQMGVSGSPPVAAAVAVAGVDLGRPDPGEPPVIAFHDTEDRTAPLHLSEWGCARARSLGTRCDTVGYQGVYTGIAQARQRDVVSRSAQFLADTVLAPLGYDVPTVGPATLPVTAGGSTTTPVATAVPATTTTTAPAAGTLPRTGTDSTAGLVRLGVALAAVGAVLVALARARRRTDAGNLKVTGTVAVGAVALLLAGVLATGDRSPRETADGTDPPTTAHDMEGMDHDMEGMDHDAEGGGVHTGGGSHDGDGIHAGGTTTAHAATHGSGAAHTGSGSTHHPSGTTATHGHGAGTTTDPSHGHDPGTPADPAHGHDPGTPTDPAHSHDPGTPTDPPTNGFDPSWTPEQVAFAQDLIDRTTAALPPYANPGVLPLLGYVWIFDGTAVDSYQHWINLGRIIDDRRLDPESPESLVFRTTADGPVLEAAMYMLQPGYNLGNVPADIAWLPGWHVHDNLCFDSGFRLVGLAVDGVCERGFLQVTPPMVHVWIVDTRCGRFAGVDENGLQCHEHQH